MSGSQRGQAGVFGLVLRFQLLVVAPSDFEGLLVEISRGPQGLVAPVPASMVEQPKLLVQIEVRAEAAAETAHLQRARLEWAA